MKKTLSLQIHDRSVEFETGRLARQANGAVLVRQGKTVVLVTVVAASEPRENAGFFPLTVEYREQIAAAGRIPGSYGRREGRLSDHEVLVSRLIDRSIRPLFPDGFRHEVQVMASVLGYGPAADPAPLALLGASAALHLSDVPFRGPSAGLTVARADGVLIALPEQAERERADLALTVSTGPDGLVMVEGELTEVGEDAVLDALDHAAKALESVRASFEQWRAECGREKMAFQAPPPEATFAGAVRERFGHALREVLLADMAKGDRQKRLKVLRQEAVAALTADAPSEEIDARVAAVETAVGDVIYDLIRTLAHEEGRRIGGREAEEIRAIQGEVAWLPSNHGSAVFTRGETQALVSCTLGTAEDELREERMAGERSNRFFLHYNFPPYAVGEARPLRGPGRREIGHGHLARRALEPVLPPRGEFPYTVRLVSTISESNGSSSMATVCGGCLAMMDAGVPLKAPVAGIAMGLLQTAKGVVVLSDILGDEDHLGDMDFKVTGTRDGVTALQMDNKVGGLDREVLARALDQARRGRLHILDRMAEILPAPRDDLPEQAPRIVGLQIRPERIGDLIGPRGAIIQEIQEVTGTRVSVNDTGQVLIYATSREAGERARRRVNWVAGDLEVGKLYKGTVVSTRNFGAFIRIMGNTEGLCHISELAEGRVEQTTDVVNAGDEVVVRVKGVTDQGKISLSLKDAQNAGAEDVVSLE